MTSIRLATSLLVITSVLTTQAHVKTRNSDPCANLQFCSSCLSKSYCSWCVNKSYCTKSSCGNDHVIYSDNVQALMSGVRFCPRVLEPEIVTTIRSGEKHRLQVRATQLYVYMAFTKWMCKVTVNGKEYVIDATLTIDLVECDPLEIINESDSAYVDGSVAVIWDHKKQFDGAMPFRVCRCDLDQKCVACKK